jgi:hypothetical protein
MNRVVCALLPLLLWACGPAGLPAPTIVSVLPEQLPQGSPSALSVKVSAVLPLSVDYQEQFVDPAQLQMTVQLAGQPVDIAFADHDGTLILPVPEGLEPGSYDIRVTLADGREALREGGFSIVPEYTLRGPGGDGGTPGDGGTLNDWQGGEDRGNIFGFWIDPIRDQVRNAPFRITIRALGRGARSFESPLSIRSSRGKVSTVTQGSFSEGVQVEEISLSRHGHNVYLVVEDADGHKGLSNPFDVRRH